jgi:hypothetical protein
MHRFFFKWFAPKQRAYDGGGLCRETRPDLARRLTGMMLGGPPGVADRSLWTLLLDNPGGERCSGQARPRRRS